MNTTAEPKTFKKQIKHTFTREEREQISADLVTELNKNAALELELKQVKSNYVAKMDDAAAKIGLFTNHLNSGFEHRMVDCRVSFRPKDKKKDFHVVATGELAVTEEMTQEDFQYEMMISDSKFEGREEIEVWSAAGDRASVVLAKAGAKWVSAIRAKLGVHVLSEQLSATKTFKDRVDAVRHAIRRLSEWVGSVSPGAEEGFKAKFDSVIEAQKARVE